MVPMPEYALILHDSMFSTPDKGHAHFLFENILTSLEIFLFTVQPLTLDLISVYSWGMPRPTCLVSSCWCPRKYTRPASTIDIVCWQKNRKQLLCGKKKDRTRSK
jgi:hypothetical protein